MHQLKNLYIATFEWSQMIVDSSVFTSLDSVLEELKKNCQNDAKCGKSLQNKVPDHDLSNPDLGGPKTTSIIIFFYYDTNLIIQTFQLICADFFHFFSASGWLLSIFFLDLVDFGALPVTWLQEVSICLNVSPGYSPSHVKTKLKCSYTQTIRVYTELSTFLHHSTVD